jgi:lysophospholipase L1-like esterase
MYPMPTLAGQPIEKGVCSPPSGSQFPAGSTTRVICQASQVPDLVNACSFEVAIVTPPRISKTKFMAFGDSITEGWISCDACAGNVSFGTGWLPFGSRALQSSRPFVVRLEKSYPTRLREMLTERYPVQEVSVLNLGISGELTDEGLLRLAAELDTLRPDVLLLLEGVNDINLSLLLAPGKPAGVGPLASNLREMVRVARGRQVEVLLATLTPATDARDLGSPGLKAAIADLNAEIRRVAAETGVGPVVDVFGALSTDISLIGEDGLHPTAAGYARMAETFLAAIVERFESSPVSIPARRGRPDWDRVR